MKITGIIFVIFGSLATLGGFIAAVTVGNTNFAGIIWIVVGAFLISRANKKKEAARKKKEWAEK